MQENKFKSGFVAVVGRPNVGKSTLINGIIGEKISIISDKPQTTRNRIMCVYTDDKQQIVFLDTPGIHKPKHKLGEMMVKAADSALKEVNVVLFVVDASQPPGAGDEYIMAKLSQLDVKVILIINKIDKLDSKEELLAIIDTYSRKFNFAAIMPMSALQEDDFSDLILELDKYLLFGPKYFPDDMITDQPERLIAAEMIREKVLHLTKDEVPHCIAVDIEQMQKRQNQDIYMRATIYVERQSQKGIIIGNKGNMLKNIGQSAREDIENLLGNKVYLELWVKVKDNWRNKSSILQEFGFGNQ